MRGNPATHRRAIACAGGATKNFEEGGASSPTSALNNRNGILPKSESAGDGANVLFLQVPTTMNTRAAHKADIKSLPEQAHIQLRFPGLSRIEEEVSWLAEAGVEERGAIFTKREVVEFILDLVGYTADQRLHTFRILEPSFGAGDFLIPIVERLILSQKRKPTGKSWLALRDAVRGVELHEKSFASTKTSLEGLLVRHGCGIKEARQLCESWLRQEDFLLSEHVQQYTHVVGNPPYVRQEMVADVLIAEYRRRFSTIYDRADLYVPFIEHGLSLLTPGGRLAFICADRWMKNKYGGPLRRLKKCILITEYF